jgi:hypothetical protein
VCIQLWHSFDLLAGSHSQLQPMRSRFAHGEYAACPSAIASIRSADGKYPKDDEQVTHLLLLK